MGCGLSASVWFLQYCLVDCWFQQIYSYVSIVSQENERGFGGREMSLLMALLIAAILWHRGCREFSCKYGGAGESQIPVDCKNGL